MAEAAVLIVAISNSPSDAGSSLPEPAPATTVALPGSLSVSSMPRSCCASSAAPGRPSGFFAITRRISSWSGSRSSADTVESGGTGSFRCIIATAIASPPWAENGSRPSSIW
jgi:hypothetical protein